MFKAITNFVVERRRLVRQSRRQVVGEANSDGAASHCEVVPQQKVDNSDPLSHPEVPPQLAETQLGEPPAPTSWKAVRLRRALGRVRRCFPPCFRGRRRKHRRSPTRRDDRVPDGSCAAGLQVTEVIGIDSSTAAPPRPPRKNFRSPLNRQPLEASVQEMGTVKWYNAAKGFGFIALDGGGNDVFVHVSALQRAGIMGLSEGQRVYVGVAEGQKGPEAASIQVAN
jgi:cold shock CspA family protein